jgi:hypothetical protein
MIDVSSSYRRHFARTCEIYPNDGRCKSPSPKADLIGACRYFRPKTGGWFNNDWDATAGLLTCLLAQAYDSVTRPLLPLAIP